MYKLSSTITFAEKNIRMGFLKELLAFKKWVKSIQPQHKFDRALAPAPPDYSKLEYWAAHPGKEDLSHFKPEGVGADDLPLEADVFFLHPTTYFRPNNWNYDFKHNQATEMVDLSIIPMQSSVFNGCCRIFAPRYRQATFHSFLKGNDNSRKALELAYEDVLDAFKYYLEYENNGRPFFIGSHSQGTCHSIRLLEEFVDGHECFSRMVAAYCIGFQFPIEKFEKGRFKNIRMATSAIDTGCVIAYDTFLDSGKPPHLLDKVEIYYPDKKKWIRRAHKKPVGVNPVSWNTKDEKVNAEQHLGCAILVHEDPKKINLKNFGTDELVGLNPIGLKAPEMEDMTTQLRKDGFLYVSKPKNPLLRRMVLPGGNLHNYDYNLFYMNLRENIKERYLAYKKNQAL